MRQLANKVKVSPKIFTPIAIAAVGILVLGGLGYRLYGQQQTLGSLQKQIQSLPSTVSPEKRVELEIDRRTLENTLFGTLVQTVGGVLLFTTAYVSYQNLKATQKNVVVAEEKQVTERFTQAINQLGSEKIEVRLGGIYALERIAKDSAKDHWTIIEVLTAFVRERSPIATLQSEDNIHPKIATDLQAALTVIGRRDLKKEEPHQLIDLSQIDLMGANLIRANLIGADLMGANLIGANLSRANLSSAFLSGAFLSGVDLIGANLSSAYLMGANLSRANLSSAFLSGAYLIHANLGGAFLSGADLSGADLSNAFLSDAYLSGAYLSGAYLSSADLSGIQNWTEAKLSAAKLCKTILPEGCNLNPNRDCEALGISLDPPATDLPE